GLWCDDGWCSPGIRPYDCYFCDFPKILYPRNYNGISEVKHPRNIQEEIMKKNQFISVITIIACLFSVLYLTETHIQAETTKTPLIKIENERLNEGDSIDLQDHVDELAELDEGSILVRYRSENEGLMSLFSLSNNEEANTYFSFYVWGGKIGSENRVTGEGDIHPVSNTPLLKTGQVHTAIMVADKEEGYSYFIDGEKVLEEESEQVVFLD